MSAIKGTWKNGQILPDQPVNWPDGCRVLIEPVEDEGGGGMREEDWKDTPEEIADWLRWYDSLEPLVMTSDEKAEWEAARMAQKNFEKAKFEERAQKLKDMFS